MFNDQFTDFSFNGISSKKMKVWITNSHDLTDVITPASNDTFVSSSFGDGRYYSGTTVTSTDITLKCAAIDITERDKHDISMWLSPRACGRLTFGFDPYHYYDVKVSGEVKATKWIASRFDKRLGGYVYIYEFSVKFTTLNDWAKLGNPVNLNVECLSKSLADYKGDDDADGIREAEWKENNYANLNNSFFLPNVVKSPMCFLPKGTYNVSESFQEFANAEQIYFLPMLLNFDDFSSIPYKPVKDSDHIKSLESWEKQNEGNINSDFTVNYSSEGKIALYYDCLAIGITTETSGANYLYPSVTYNYTVTNLGTEPLLMFYFVSGELNGKFTLYANFENYEYLNVDLNTTFDTYYAINYNIIDGTVLYNGDLIQRAATSTINIWNSNTYINNGGLSIDPGEPEIIALDKVIQVKHQTYNKYSINNNQLGGSQSENFPDVYCLEIDTTNLSIKHEHYGFCHVSFYNQHPVSSDTYSIIVNKKINLTNDVISFNGYCIPQENKICIIVNLVDATMKTTPSIQPWAYSFMSISTAHPLNLGYTIDPATGDDDNESNVVNLETLSIQTREA